jgi:hypothetical protein
LEELAPLRKKSLDALLARKSSMQYSVLHAIRKSNTECELHWRHEVTYNAAIAWVSNALCKVSSNWRLDRGSSTVKVQSVKNKTTPKMLKKPAAQAEGRTAQQHSLEKKAAPAIGETPRQAASATSTSRPQNIALAAEQASCAAELRRQWLTHKAIRAMSTTPTSSDASSNSNYSRGKLLAEGTYGRVYFGRSRTTQLEVVIKVLKTRNWKDYLHEVDALSRLRHENLVSIVDVEPGHSLSIVLDFAGASLREHLSDHRRDAIFQNWKPLAVSLLRCIAFLHQQCVFHTDIKPSNVAVDAAMHLRVLDLGSVVVGLPTFRTEHTMQQIEAEGGLAYCTLWYRSIELLLGDPKWGAPLDAWSCGCVLMEMATARVIFRHESESSMIRAIMQWVGPLAEVDLVYIAMLPLWRARYAASAARVVPSRRMPTRSDEEEHLVLSLLQIHPGRRARVVDVLRDMSRVA